MNSTNGLQGGFYDFSQDPVRDAYESASLREWVARILVTQPVFLEEAEEFLDRYHGALELLFAAPCVKRMALIRQFGVKRASAGRVLSDRSFGCETGLVRLDHVTQVAAHALALCIRSNVKWGKTILCVFAAILHDGGYGAFSHDGENVLLKLGLPGHEIRSCDLVQNDTYVREAILATGISYGYARCVIRQLVKERTWLGAVQNLCDPLSYTQHDSRFAAHSALPDPGFGIRVIMAVDGSGKNDSLRVQSTELFQELLDVRAKLSRDVYFQPDNRLRAMAMRALCVYLVHTEQLDPKTMVSAVDAQLYAILQNLMDSSGDQVVRAMFDLAFGHTDLDARWREFSCSGEEACNALRQEFSGSSRIWFEVPSRNFLNRTLPVQLPGGEEVTLRAKIPPLDPSYAQTRLFTYTGE